MCGSTTARVNGSFLLEDMAGAVEKAIVQADESVSEIVGSPAYKDLFGSGQRK
jgi:hypothetical protein